MSTGEIRDFSKPNPKPDPKTLPDEIQRLSGATGVEGVDVRLHEKVITVNDLVRVPKQEPGDPEIRLRYGPLNREWNDMIKRMDEE